MLLPMTERPPVNIALHPSKMSMHRNGIIASVKNTVNKRPTETLPHMPTTNRDIKCAGIAIEVWIPLGHFLKNMEVFRVQQTALGSTMRRDHFDSTLQRQLQGPWV